MDKPSLKALREMHEAAEGEIASGSRSRVKHLERIDRTISALPALLDIAEADKAVQAARSALDQALVDHADGAKLYDLGCRLVEAQERRSTALALVEE